MSLQPDPQTKGPSAGLTLSDMLRFSIVHRLILEKPEPVAVADLEAYSLGRANASEILSSLERLARAGLLEEVPRPESSSPIPPRIRHFRLGEAVVNANRPPVSALSVTGGNSQALVIPRVASRELRSVERETLPEQIALIRELLEAQAREAVAAAERGASVAVGISEALDRAMDHLSLLGQQVMFDLEATRREKRRPSGDAGGNLQSGGQGDPHPERDPE